MDLGVPGTDVPAQATANAPSVAATPIAVSGFTTDRRLKIARSSVAAPLPHCADHRRTDDIGIPERIGAVNFFSWRCSRWGRRVWASSVAGRGQHAAPAARSARTNGVEAVSWSTQNLFAGVGG